jgi:predicted HAD superfamily Cof-like phosphohydrolase
MWSDILAFHKKFSLPIPSRPTKLVNHLRQFRVNFLDEELNEYKAALGTGDMEQQLDALVDLVYVALGTAVMQGFDFEEAWRRVHAANMLKTKYSRTNPGKRKSRFDVVKPVGWIRPDLRDLVK